MNSVSAEERYVDTVDLLNAVATWLAAPHQLNNLSISYCQLREILLQIVTRVNVKITVDVFQAPNKALTSWAYPRPIKDVPGETVRACRNGGNIRVDL